MEDFKNDEQKIKYNKFKILFSVNPFDVFGVYNKKGLDFSEFFPYLFGSHIYNEEVKKVKKIQKQIIKEEKRQEIEKEKQEQEKFNKRMDSYLANKKRGSILSDDYYKDFLTRGEKYDYNDVMDDLESEGYAVDE